MTKGLIYWNNHTDTIPLFSDNHNGGINVLDKRKVI